MPKRSNENDRFSAGRSDSPGSSRPSGHLCAETRPEWLLYLGICRNTLVESKDCCGSTAARSQVRTEKIFAHRA